MYRRWSVKATNETNDDRCVRAGDATDHDTVRIAKGRKACHWSTGHRCALVMCAMLCLLPFGGCKPAQKTEKSGVKLDVTVVEDEDVPQELMEIIENRKSGAMQFTFLTNDYLYAVCGYGTQTGSGYSIALDGVYLDDAYICVNTTLMGPKSGEASANVNTYPYIVVKMERREEPVMFR